MAASCLTMCMLLLSCFQDMMLRPFYLGLLLDLHHVKAVMQHCCLAPPHYTLIGSSYSSRRPEHPRRCPTHWWQEMHHGPLIDSSLNPHFLRRSHSLPPPHRIRYIYINCKYHMPDPTKPTKRSSQPCIQDAQSAHPSWIFSISHFRNILCDIPALCATPRLSQHLSLRLVASSHNWCID